jgi:general secretion pathway protein A
MVDFKSENHKKGPFFREYSPEFYYLFAHHKILLEKLRDFLGTDKSIAIILGDRGAGKTSLMYYLGDFLSQDGSLNVWQIARNHYKSQFEFLQYLSQLLRLNSSPRSLLAYRESILEYFLQQSREGSKNIFILDNGEHLKLFLLEAWEDLLKGLRRSNNHTGLKIILFSGFGFLDRARRLEFFTSEVGLKYSLNPLSASETKELIEFRLARAGYNSGKGVFSEKTVRDIYVSSRGYPGEIIPLCREYMVSLPKEEADK